MVNFASSMKKAIATVLSAAMVLTIAGAQNPAAVKAADKDEVTIQVLQTSDLHGKFLPFNYATASVDDKGSLAQVATLIKQYRNDNTLLIDCGDTIQDNMNSIFNTEEYDMNPMITGMNELHYDAVLYGNHEFNYGVPTLKRVFSKIASPTAVLCDNVYDIDGKTLLSGQAYKIFNKGGVRVAVIGSVTPNIDNWDIENLKNYKVTDPVEETKKIVNKIKADKSADLIIVATHMSSDNELGAKDSGYVDMANALNRNDVPLILAAHGHEQVDGTKTENKGIVNDIHVMENINQGQTLGKAEITMEKEKDGTYSVKSVKTESVNVKNGDKVVAADPVISEKLAKYDAAAKAYAAKVIGAVSGSPLIGEADVEGIPQGQVADSAFMDLINTVQMKKAGARVSAAALFSTSANVQPGSFKRSDASNVYKFDNTLYKVEISGKALKEYMEWSANYFNQAKEGDVSISFNPEMKAYLYDMFAGVDYDINISKPAGSRIENLVYSDNKAPVLDSDKIIMAVNNYRFTSQLASTKNGVIKNEADVPKLIEKDVNAGEGVREMILDYIENDLNGVIDPAKIVDNNWKITGKTWTDADTAEVNKLVKEEKLKLHDSEDGRTPNIKSITMDEVKAADPVYTPAKEETKPETKEETKVTKKAKPAKVTLSSVKSTAKNTVKVTFKKAKDASKYVVYYSYKKNMKNAKKVTLSSSKRSTTIKKLTSSKKVYVRVRAYNTVDGKNQYGKYSAVKSVKVK